MNVLNQGLQTYRALKVVADALSYILANRKKKLTTAAPPPTDVRVGKVFVWSLEQWPSHTNPAACP